MKAKGRRHPTFGGADWLPLVVVGLLVAGCGSAAVTPSPRPSTTSPTSAPVGSASAEATRRPTASPAAIPTPATTPPPATTATPAATATPSPSKSSPEPSVAPATQTVIPWGPYVVEYGDTLWDIGQRYGVTTDALEATNPQISDPTLIRVGDEITIPPTDWTAPVRPFVNGTVVDSDLDGVADLGLIGVVAVWTLAQYRSSR